MGKESPPLARTASRRRAHTSTAGGLVPTQFSLYLRPGWNHLHPRHERAPPTLF